MDQIVAILKQTEVGIPVADLIRQPISEQTFYRWKKAVRWAGGRPRAPKLRQVNKWSLSFAFV
jgi:hypothetical protein